MSDESMQIQSGVAGPSAVGGEPSAIDVTSIAPAIEPGALLTDGGLNDEVARDRRNSLAVRTWQRMRHEPSLMFTTAYVFVSCIGLWANFWFYRGFHLPILEYMQVTDYLVAGLRDPFYALVMVFSVAGIFLVSWPDIWRRRHPVRVAQLQRHWWGRLLFPRSNVYRWKGVGMTPETGLVVAALWGTAGFTAAYVHDKAADIRNGNNGSPVQVTLAGDATPQPGRARLLGTSGSFVFLWWPEQQRAEAVPIESVGRLTVLPRAAKPGAPTKAATAPAQAPPVPNPKYVPAAEPAASAK